MPGPDCGVRRTTGRAGRRAPAARPSRRSGWEDADRGTAGAWGDQRGGCPGAGVGTGRRAAGAGGWRDSRSGPNRSPSDQRALMEKLVITASSGSFSGLVDELRKISVQAIERPLTSSQPPEDWARLDEALNHRERYGSLALTSPRAAAAVADRIRACAISWVGRTPRVWAVGAATAQALQGSLGSVQGSFPEPNADLGAAERLARVMLSAGAAGPVLFPCGENRRDELPAILRSNGLVVDEVICYRMVLASLERARRQSQRGSASGRGLRCLQPAGSGCHRSHHCRRSAIRWVATRRGSHCSLHSGPRFGHRGAAVPSLT